jgi:hypothetical protein
VNDFVEHGALQGAAPGGIESDLSNLGTTLEPVDEPNRTAQRVTLGFEISPIEKGRFVEFLLQLRSTSAHTTGLALELLAHDLHGVAHVPFFVRRKANERCQPEGINEVQGIAQRV